MSLKKTAILVFTVLAIFIQFRNASGQAVPQPVANQGIYDFLDEMAALHLTEINSAVKPWSRLFIAQCLEEIDGKRDRLNIRQQKELDFYILDFGKEMQWHNGTMAQRRRGSKLMGKKLPSSEGPGVGWLKAQQSNGPMSADEGQNTDSIRAMWFKGPGHGKRFDVFYYRDSLFSITVNPIFGGEMFHNAEGKATYWRNGIEARSYIGHWGFFASLRDNHEKPLLGLPQYLTPRTDGHIKNGNDWSEMQGGITYSWRWGDAGLVKDNLEWGDNYDGANIFGGNNPTFVQLKLHLKPAKWFDFNYFHGWLNSMVVDSSKSYWVSNSYGTSYREEYHSKFIAANMFTFIPFRYLYLSAGNSIIYDADNVNPAYLIPLFFYKSVDHTLSSGINNMNSQMFFNVSSRQVKHLHLYAAWFIDEMSVKRFTEKDQWNFFSYKAGFRLSDFPVQDLSFTTEFTYTYPLTFQHNVPTLTFENVDYNLGHYLKDNAREWYLAFDYHPVRTMDINIFFSDAIRGPDYTALGTDRLGNPPLASVEWHNRSYGIKASYQVINDLYTWGSFIISDISGNPTWTPGYFFGKRNTFNFGVTYGF